MRAFHSVARTLAILVLISFLQACGTAIAAGAGAAAAIAYSDRGVSSKVQGSVDEVFARSQAVFQEMGITQTAVDSNTQGTERELQGREGDLEITVDIKRENDRLTAVEVFAQRTTVDWDRDYARRVLERIIARS